MAKGINTNSKEWCDLVFKDKNKSYGAYKMRRTSSKRHVIAFLTVLIAVTIFALMPAIIERIEFYLFQNTDSDYLVEDYKYISESLSEVELQQLAKQYIPNPAKTKTKTAITEDKLLKDQKISARIPVIVADALLKNIPEDDYMNDTAAVADLLDKPEEQTETEQDSNLYTIVELMPSFPGGESGLMEYIYKNLRYPQEAIIKKIENCVICSFIIDSNGSVKDAKVTQAANPLLDKEALRIINSLPRWKPARQHNKQVRVKFTLPIVFRLK